MKIKVLQAVHLQGMFCKTFMRIKFYCKLKETETSKFNLNHSAFRKLEMKGTLVKMFDHIKPENDTLGGLGGSRISLGGKYLLFLWE